MSSSSGNQKALRFDTAKIRALSLLFENKALEDRWDSSHKSRLRAMTVRYLFASGLFQGMFLWSDVLESHNDQELTEGLFLKSMIRLVLGGVPLILCFIYAIGVASPSQMTVFIANLLYGIPTLALYFLSRRVHSHWDSLFLIYGLAFFMLPKLSPLNFIYGVSGSAFLSLMYTYLSAFRLSLSEWLLSNFLLGIIFILMGYLSYSTEKASRERWLLKERLQREKISVKLVASSIQDDLRRAANEERLRTSQRMAELGTIKDEMKSVATNLALRAPGFMRRGVSAENVAPSSALKDEDNTARDTGEDDGKNSDKQKSIDLKKNLALFFKGLMAWGIIVLLSYTFDMVSRSHDFDADSKSEANSSAAFALLMHTSGFSVFLLYFTGQIRWLLINGLVGLSLMWVLNQSGMEQKWVVFGTHTAGYVILVVVVITMILVFGGVVLVWTNLIDFLKDILNRYPQVKNELSENKLLEQVIVTYISQLPNDHVKSEGEGHNVSLQVLKGGTDEESSTSLISSGRGLLSTHSGGGGKKGKKGKGGAGGRAGERERSSSASFESLTSNNSGSVAMQDVLVPASGRSCCYFCLKNDNKLCYVPACSAWRRREGPEALDSAMMSSYPACTSFADMSMARNDALFQSKQVTADWLHLNEVLEQLEEEKESSRRAAENSLKQAQKNTDELERQLQASRADGASKLEQQRKEGSQALKEAERAHQVFVAEQRVSAERDIDTLREQVGGYKKRLSECEVRLEEQTRELESKASAVEQTQQPPPQTRARTKSQSFASSPGVAQRAAVMMESEHAEESLHSQSSPHLNKHGVDITSRNARRNANNPNNPNYNPRLRKGQKRDEWDGFDAGMVPGGSTLLDGIQMPAQMPPPGLSGPSVLQERGYSPFLSQDAVGGALRMSAFDQPSPEVSHVPPQSRSLLQASTVPVYSGTLNLGLSDHGLGGAPGNRGNTPTLQRDVITNVISSLALDGDEDGEGDGPLGGLQPGRGSYN